MLDPYIILVTNYREPGQTGAGFGSTRRRSSVWMNAAHGALARGRLPAGFQMGKTQFHIYGSGLELGSNVGAEPTLTRDEAHQYIVIDHLATQ